MDRLSKNKKLLQEKENFHHHCNQKKDVFASVVYKYSIEQLYHSYAPRKHQCQIEKQIIQQKPLLKNNSETYCDLYAKTILHTSSITPKHQKNFLQNHEITPYLRARMLDWMIEVTSSYKFCHKTYFDGISVMDRYFQNETDDLSPAKLHITGIISMLIASKMEEVFPLKIRTTYEKIGHQKISIQDLVQTEEIIAKKLSYQTNSWTFFDLAMLKINAFFSQQKTKQSQKQPLREQYASEGSVLAADTEAQEQQMQKIEDLVSYLCKFIFFDYQLYCSNSENLLSEMVVKKALQIMNIKGYNSCHISMIELQVLQKKMVDLIGNYKKNYPGLTNIYKFSSKEVMALVKDSHPSH